MAYTPPDYPAAIPDEVTDLPDRLDDIDWIEAARYNELKKELVAVMTELGTDPAGASTDVKTRLALLALIASPTFTGEATIPTIDLTGGQIKFPATQNASADANTLDDYEEGTFTVAFTAGTGTIVVDTADDTFVYTKIGRIVHIQGRAVVDSVDTPTGAWSMTGLPFTSAALTENADYPPFLIAFADTNSVPLGLVGRVSPGGTIMTILEQTATNLTTAADLAKATTTIYINGFYVAA